MMEAGDEETGKEKKTRDNQRGKRGRRRGLSLSSLRLFPLVSEEIKMAGAVTLRRRL